MMLRNQTHTEKFRWYMKFFAESFCLQLHIGYVRIKPSENKDQKKPDILQWEGFL